MRLTLSLVVVAVLAIGCGGDDTASTTTAAAAEELTTLAPAVTTTTAATSSTAAPTTTEPPATTTTSGVYDPYQAFIDLGGGDLWEQENGGPVISREDAQIRAFLGCSTEWAPGTIDGLLAEAYRAQEGFCGN